MPIEKFTTLISTCVPLYAENVDTDQIIPARFLRSVSRLGFGEKLFYDWRYDRQGNHRKDFVMNDYRFKGEVLVAGKNFGCGSSREHAAWAIIDYGFRVVVSSSFADIFRNNALNNGLLTIELPERFLERLFNIIKSAPSTEVKVDLPRQLFEVLGGGLVEEFEIPPYKKKCLLKGYDDIDYLVSHSWLIEKWEKQNNKL